MQRIYPQYFAYLASSVIAANFLDKKLSLIDKMCVIQHKNRKFYPILWYTKKTFFSVGKNCKKFVVSGLFIILFYLLAKSHFDTIWYWLLYPLRCDMVIHR